ncbi:MAG: DUF1150 family protein [Alphaproteobacteria bacterium]|nr:DUF1150 family protein [Alphaproteobacteria bacterium]
MQSENINQSRELSLKTITTQDFLRLGVAEVAYIKPLQVIGHTLYAVHAADGTPLAMAETPAAAAVLARQNELEPVTLH